MSLRLDALLDRWSASIFIAVLGVGTFQKYRVLVTGGRVLGGKLRRINRSTGIVVYWYTLAASDTTVKISKNTLSELERLREEFNAKSIDETVRALIRERRRKLLAAVFGSDKGRVTPFSEADRGEDR